MNLWKVTLVVLTFILVKSSLASELRKDEAAHALRTKIYENRYEILKPAKRQNTELQNLAQKIKHAFKSAQSTTEKTRLLRKLIQVEDASIDELFSKKELKIILDLAAAQGKGLELGTLAGALIYRRKFPSDEGLKIVELEPILKTQQLMIQIQSVRSNCPSTQWIEDSLPKVGEIDLATFESCLALSKKTDQSIVDLNLDDPKRIKILADTLKDLKTIEAADLGSKLSKAALP